GYPLLMKDMGRMLGAGASIAECRELARIMVEEEEDFRVRLSSVTGLCEGMTGREEVRGASDILEWILQGTNWKKQEELLERVIQKAGDYDSTEKERIAAIHLLGFTRHPESLPVLRSALHPETLPSVQQAAVQAIVNQGSQAGGETLTEQDIWRGFTPKVRSSV